MNSDEEWSNVIGGIVLVAVLHFIAFWVYFGLLALLIWVNDWAKISLLTQFVRNYTWLSPLFFPGLMQIFYVLPVVLFFRRRRKWALAKGMIIGAIITGLLNGLCFMTIGQIR